MPASCAEVAEVPLDLRNLEVLDGRAEALSLVLAVIGVTFLGKGYLGYGEFHNPWIRLNDGHDGGIFDILLRVLCCCAEDVVVALACLVLVIGALRAAPAGWWRGTIRVLVYAGAVAALLYLVGSFKLFRLRQEFLRADLFWIGGGFAPNVHVVRAAGRKTILALAFAPLLFLWIHRATMRAWPEFWRGASRLMCRPALLVLLAVGLLILGPTLRRWAGTEGNDLGRNPLLVMLSSFLERKPWFVDGVAANDVNPMIGRPSFSGQLLADPPKNLIVIVGESVNARHFELYGCPFPTTPNLRALASKSLIFENHYALSNYSFGSGVPLFTGICGDPTERHSSFDDHPGFRPPSVASHLRSLGYRTYFFGAGGSAVWDTAGMGRKLCTEGFDVSQDPGAPFWRKTARPDAFNEESYTDEMMFADATRALGEAGGDRFAMILWNNDTHFPYLEGPGPDDWLAEHMPPAARGSAFWEPKYRSYLRAVWRLDRLIGQLYQKLESLGIAEDTLIVVTGDHGESFGERGRFGHFLRLHDEQVRVPLVLINPRLATLGARNHQVCSNLDVWPTLADICSFPPDSRWQGRSLARDTPEPARVFFFSGRNESYGMREGKWKYFWYWRRAGHFLYDLEADPGETTNLAGGLTDRCGEMNRQVISWLRYHHNLTLKTSLNK